jgi:hypothetical protein
MDNAFTLSRYAEAGGRRIVASGGKITSVVLTEVDKEWAERDRYVDQQFPPANTNEIVTAFRRWWRVVITDGEVYVTMLSR